MYEDLEFDILDLSEVSGEKKLDVFNMYGIEAKPSDLATINSGSKEGYYLNEFDNLK